MTARTVIAGGVLFAYLMTTIGARTAIVAPAGGLAGGGGGSSS